MQLNCKVAHRQQRVGEREGRGKGRDEKKKNKKQMKKRARMVGKQEHETTAVIR